MNLVRAGHFFTPDSTTGPDGLPTGDCKTATVAHVWSDTVVNIAVLDHNGNPESGRTSVPVCAPSTQGNSFHLSADCPWKR